jgi:signal transduction histidine kinase
MLDFARPAAGSVTPVPVNAVAAESIESLRRELGRRGLVPKLELDPAEPSVLADAAMLRQVVSSLIVNAMEATEEKGVVAVSTQLAPDRRTVRIRVDDTGHGIAHEQLPLVLRPFHTTKPKGLGLGLPLAKRIVERFGGTLEIESMLGRGTSVELSLPAVA